MFGRAEIIMFKVSKLVDHKKSCDSFQAVSVEYDYCLCHFSKPVSHVCIWMLYYMRFASCLVPPANRCGICLTVFDFTLQMKYYA